jgi:hypothetical protein
MSTVPANDRCESYATGSDRVVIRVSRISATRFALGGFGLPLSPSMADACTFQQHPIGPLHR